MNDLLKPAWTVADVPRLLLTYDQAADALSISKAELERIVAAGDIQPFRHGRLVRFTVEMLEDWIQKNIPDPGA
jgi:excisionase family DNA binding protein